MVMDFERALRSVVRSVLEVIITGRVSHWTQAVWQKVKQKTYFALSSLTTGTSLKILLYEQMNYKNALS